MVKKAKNTQLQKLQSKLEVKNLELDLLKLQLKTQKTFLKFMSRRAIQERNECTKIRNIIFEHFSTDENEQFVEFLENFLDKTILNKENDVVQIDELFLS